jgi:peptidoglycan hydrolase-like protein with peptidoglycan-binding domain
MYPSGRYSDETMSLQRALILNGFDVGKDGADGIMGSTTIKAVIAAREHYGLAKPSEPRIDLPLLLALGVRSKAPEPPPKPNKLQDWLLSLAIKQGLAKLFPGKEIDVDNILVAVKSAWLSKLNWTLAVGALFNIFAAFGLNVPADVKDAIVMVGNGVVLIAAWVIKTWFTTTISAASAAKAAK